MLSLASNPSISTNNWFNVDALSELRSRFLLLPTASNSSIKIIHFFSFFALLNKSRTRRAPTPTYISTNELPASLMIGISNVCAIFLTSNVLPVPGGPANKIP